MSNNGSAFGKGFFANTKFVHIEMDMHEDLWEALKTACEEPGWETLAGLSFIVAIGLIAVREIQRRYQSGEQTSEDLQSSSETSDS